MVVLLLVVLMQWRYCGFGKDHCCIFGYRPEGSTLPPVGVAEGETVLEGWQKYWEEPPSTNTSGLPPANIKWLKGSEQHCLFSVAKPYRSPLGEVVLRKTLKNQMEFHPPPLPCVIGAGLPSMLSFFTTPVFFWRPVGVMKTNIKCPNSNCPAPSGTYLIRGGYGTSARQLCRMRHYYTVLTERLKSSYCRKMRHAGPEQQDGNSDDDVDETTEQQQQQQYMWLAWRPAILMALAPALCNIFPVILCGIRVVDKNVVTQLGDWINAVSTNNVHWSTASKHLGCMQVVVLWKDTCIFMLQDFSHWLILVSLLKIIIKYFISYFLSKSYKLS